MPTSQPALTPPTCLINAYDTSLLSTFPLPEPPKHSISDFENIASSAALSGRNSTVMLTDLGDTYRQYKAGTRSITTWLANTAIDCDPSEARRLQHSNRTSTKAKGKDGRYLLQVSDITRLARNIVSSGKPGSRVPVEKIKLIKNTVELRTQCATWYTSRVLSGHITGQDHHNHVHFIEVLHELLRILEPHIARPPQAPTPRLETPRPKKSKTALAQPRPTTPIFYDESYYAPLPNGASSDTDEPLIESTHSRSNTASTSPKKKQMYADESYDVESTEDDVRLAIFCFFEKLGTVRKFIRGVWQDCEKGKFNPTAAYMAVTCGLQVAYAAECALTSEFEYLTGYLSIAEALHVRIPAVCTEQDPKIPLPYFRIYTWLLHFAGLAQEQVSLDATVSAELKHEANLQSDSSTSEAGSSQAKAKADELGLIKLASPGFRPLLRLFFVFLLSRSPGQGLAVAEPDRFTAGAAAVFKGATIPFWLVLAGQCTVDMFTELSDTSRIFRLAYATADRELHVYEVTRELTTESSKPYHFELEVEYAWNRVIRDPYAEVLRDIDRALAKTSRSPLFDTVVSEEHSFLKANPFLSGKLAFEVLFQSYAAGRSVFDLDSNLFAVAHLYNAGRKSHFIRSVWKDVELLIHFHGEQNIFVGKAPSDAGAYIRWLLLSHGQSIQKYAKNARSNLPTTSSRPRRKMRALTLVHDIDNCMEQDFLSMSRRDVQVEVDGMIKRARERHTTGESHTMWQDLESLKLQAIEEEAHLHFSYLQFFCFTAPLLDEVLKAPGPDPTDEFWDVAKDWTELAISILQVNSHVRHGLKNESGTAYADYCDYTNALKTVSVVLEEWIKKGGHQLSNRMEKGVATDLGCFHKSSAASVDKLPEPAPAPPTTDAGLSLLDAALKLAANVGGGKIKSPGEPQHTSITASHESYDPLHLVPDPAVSGAESLHEDTEMATRDQLAYGIPAVAISNPPADIGQTLKSIDAVTGVPGPAREGPLSTTPSVSSGSSTPISQLATPTPQGSRPWSRFETLRHQAQVDREMQAAKPAMFMSSLAREKMLDAKRQREKEEKAKAEEIEARRVMIKAQREALEKETTNSKFVSPITQDQKLVENRLDTYFEARQEHWMESFLMEDGEKMSAEVSESPPAPSAAGDTHGEPNEGAQHDISDVPNDTLETRDADSKVETEVSEKSKETLTKD